MGRTSEVTNSKSPNAYPDCRAFLDRAIAATSGTRLVLGRYGPAYVFRNRCYALRGVQARQNAKIYPDADHILHGVTVWHKLTLKVISLPPEEPGDWRVVGNPDDGIWTTHESVESEFQEIRKRLLVREREEHI